MPQSAVAAAPTNDRIPTFLSDLMATPRLGMILTQMTQAIPGAVVLPGMED